jgi:hypothetical protein
MRTSSRLLRAALAGMAAAVPSRAAGEAVVSAAFVVLLLALALQGGHRPADASAAHFRSDKPDAGSELRPFECRADLRGNKHRPLATRSIHTHGTRCGDLPSYV